MFSKFIFIGFLCVCISELGYSQNTILHPNSENIPYISADKIIISDKVDELKKLPKTIFDFQQKFEDGNSNLRELPILLSDTFSSGFFQTGSSQIGVVDLKEDVLYNYNLKDNKYEIIAGPGRGPGDIGYSKDYSFKDSLLLIASEDYRLSFFNCTNGLCQFKRLLNTDLMPYSVTITDRGFALVGMNNILSPQNSSPPDENDKIVGLYNNEGVILRRIFEGYTSNSMLVRNYYNRSTIRYINSINSIVIGLKNLPYIYFYNLTNDEVKVFKIENFFLRKVTENTGKNSLKMNYDKYSIIETVEVLNGRYIYIGVRSHLGEKKDHGFENHVNYYMIDSKTFRSYHIGIDKYRKKSLSRKPILENKDNDIIMNREGKISVILK